MKRIILAAALIALPGLACAQYGAGQQRPAGPEPSPGGLPVLPAAAKVSVNIPRRTAHTPTYPGGAAMRAMDDKRKVRIQLTHFK